MLLFMVKKHGLQDPGDFPRDIKFSICSSILAVIVLAESAEHLSNGTPQGKAQAPGDKFNQR